MNADLTSSEVVALQRLFWAELAQGLPGAERALSHLAIEAEAPRAWADLRRLFHRCGGPAGSIGLALLGRLCRMGEAVCDQALASGAAQAPQLQGAIATALGGLQEALEAQPRAASEAVLFGSVKAAGDEGEKVVVVDDDLEGGELTVELLQQAGYQAVQISDPAHAMDALLTERPDLLILDVTMPALDGFEICRRVRQHPGLQFLPIIFLSGRHDIQERLRGLELGANDYLLKPFAPSELVARVRSHLGLIAALREMAVRDGLTGCYNHKYFKSRLEQEVARSRRYGVSLAVGLLDIDHFKQVNDSHGHATGDSVLARLANLVSASVRSTDVVARYGGEEFGLLLIEAGTAEAKIILDRMRQRIATYRFATGAGETSALSVTVSVGIAQARADETPQGVLDRADQALYAAKSAGRNQIQVAAT